MAIETTERGKVEPLKDAFNEALVRLKVADLEETDPRLQGLSAKIYEARKGSEEDPDDEQDGVVSEDTASNANVAAVFILKQVTLAGVEWIRPSISATPTGGFQFSWRSKGYSLSLTVRADAPEVTVIEKKPSEVPTRQVVDVQTGAETVPLFLQAVHGA